MTDGQADKKMEGGGTDGLMAVCFASTTKGKSWYVPYTCSVTVELLLKHHVFVIHRL